MTTFIDTSQCARFKLAGAGGEGAEIVNNDLCGANDVTAKLRWLKNGERLEAGDLGDTHQLIYLMQGDGVINLDGKDYEVPKGGGVYLGPGETARVAHAGSGTLKLLHLVVPIAGH